MHADGLAKGLRESALGTPGLDGQLGNDLEVDLTFALDTNGDGIISRTEFRESQLIANACEDGIEMNHASKLESEGQDS